MESITTLIDLFLRLDVHLHEIIIAYGSWTYGILFLIIFCETGLVATPFLPGDSLLFAAGTFAGLGSLDPHWLFLLLTAAGILGDTVNYWIGFRVGPKIFHYENVRFLNKKHLERAHAFYERHGGKTIIIARFIPIIRTFAPFVAGIGRMTYSRFLVFNVVGAVLWVGIFVYGGYFFGNLPVVRKNFTLVIIVIILLSIMPPVIEYFRHRNKAAA